MHSLVEYTIGWLGSSLIAEYRPTDRTNERTNERSALPLNLSRQTGGNKCIV